MKYILLFSFLMISVHVFSQNLTKEQTVGYVSEKLQEAENHTRANGSTGVLKITQNKFARNLKKKDTEVLYLGAFVTNTGISETKLISFPPAKIKEITLSMSDTKSDVGLFTIGFDGSVAYWASSDGTNISQSYLSHITIYFLQTDKLMFERLNKALMHLKDRYTAEIKRDPFAN